MLSVDEARDVRTSHRFWPDPVAEPEPMAAGFAVLVSAPRSAFREVEQDLQWLKDARVSSGLQRRVLQLQLSPTHRPLRDELAAQLRMARLSGEVSPVLGMPAETGEDLLELLDSLLPDQRRRSLEGLRLLQGILGESFSAREDVVSVNRLVSLELAGIEYLSRHRRTSCLTTANAAYLRAVLGGEF